MKKTFSLTNKEISENYSDTIFYLMLSDFRGAVGSGTTCLSAKELNRKFIGIEKEPKYYEIARERCDF